MGVRRDNRRVLSPFIREGATGSELGESGRARGGIRYNEVLDGEGMRRLPCMFVFGIYRRDLTNIWPQMDVINMISKVDGLPDAVITSPGEPYQPAGLLYVNG